MKTEDKQLLIQDLCTRLPYGVKIKFATVEGIILDCVDLYASTINYDYPIEDVKPYLFPLSSMTEEQVDEIYKTLGFDVEDELTFDQFIEYFDWLYAHHFDVHRLIDKDLAIDATNLNIY